MWAPPSLVHSPKQRSSSPHSIRLLQEANTCPAQPKAAEHDKDKTRTCDDDEWDEDASDNSTARAALYLAHVWLAVRDPIHVSEHVQHPSLHTSHAFSEHTSTVHGPEQGERVVKHRRHIHLSRRWLNTYTATHTISTNNQITQPDDTATASATATA